MKVISIIVAVAENNAIGIDNKLLCHLSDDLKRFKKLTMDNVVVMGKKTYESLPVKPLPKRENIVLTDNHKDEFCNCTMAFSIEDAIAKMSDEKENFIIGGGSIYKQFMSVANRFYLTKIHAEFEADTFFPEIDFDDWKIISENKIEKDEKNEYSYTYLVMERKDNL